MSKDSAQKFLDDVNTNDGLKKKLLGAATNAQAWVASASTAGYQMTVDELRAATEAVVGKPVSGDELLGALRGLFEGELGDASLDAVTGGVGPISAAPKKLLHITTQAVSGGLSPDDIQGKPAPAPAPAPAAQGGGGGAL